MQKNIFNLHSNLMLNESLFCPPHLSSALPPLQSYAFHLRHRLFPAFHLTLPSNKRGGPRHGNNAKKKKKQKGKQKRQTLVHPIPIDRQTLFLGSPLDQLDSYIVSTNLGDVKYFYESDYSSVLVGVARPHSKSCYTQGKN